MLFQKVTGTQVTMVQYKGAAPALLDVQAGRVDLLCDVTAGIAKYVAAGGVRGYVLPAPERLDSLPDLPTSQQAGQIGRASCREKECKYVYIPVVAGSITKKKPCTSTQ